MKSKSLRKNEEKAITLVALIITIIILLILAVVTIQTVQGDGIISHAKNAQTRYEEVQAEEQNMLSKYKLMLAQEKGTAWKQNRTKVKKGGITLEVGDTVNYDETKGGTVTVPVDVEWKVLGEENGQILLMSTASVTTDILMWGSADSDNYYDVAIEKINDACSAYGQGNGASGVRSIKLEDINRIISNKTTYGVRKVTYTLGEDGDTLTRTVEGNPERNSSVKLSEGPGVFVKPDRDATDLKAGESYVIYETYYSYEGKENLETTSKAYQMLFGNTDNNSYLSYCLGSFYVGVIDEYACEFRNTESQQWRIKWRTFVGILEWRLC